MYPAPLATYQLTKMDSGTSTPFSGNQMKRLHDMFVHVCVCVWSFRTGKDYVDRLLSSQMEFEGFQLWELEAPPIVDLAAPFELTPPLSPTSTSSGFTMTSSPRPTKHGQQLRRRGVRCTKCQACLRKDDCGKCVNCV